LKGPLFFYDHWFFRVRFAFFLFQLKWYFGAMIGISPSCCCAVTLPPLDRHCFFFFYLGHATFHAFHLPKELPRHKLHYPYPPPIFMTSDRIPPPNSLFFLRLLNGGIGGSAFLPAELLLSLSKSSAPRNWSLLLLSL